jgi:HK97 gp10 family phage protein
MSVVVHEKMNHLDTFAARARELVHEANLELGQRMGDTAREIVPVETGELQESIEVERTDEKTVVVSAGTDHAEPVEFGTVHMAAQPFMLPAFDRHAPEADDVFGKAVREAAGGS